MRLVCPCDASGFKAWTASTVLLVR
ncbi:hypothetical protein PVL29_009778 [Vitis rotundifolia]|uniref:Uncharacterized protein n=1 Tax=Vitis rotundifolia TaxID=103349 RepID=A0AA39DTV8_VITRO|nr:hypothetical protein PVL29_009778 [Vitis rotundifolia]